MGQEVTLLVLVHSVGCLLHLDVSSVEDHEQVPPKHYISGLQQNDPPTGTMNSPVYADISGFDQFHSSELSEKFRPDSLSPSICLCSILLVTEK